MPRILHLIKKYRYPLLLTAVSFFIFISNYQPGTYLFGWDNLQTELYPELAIKRAFFAVWEEYQSFGLVSGLAHAADILRALTMWLLSFILPQTMQRLFFHSAMLAVGALGMYRLLRYLHIAENRPSVACIGALFYLLNLGTIQIFALPLESFSIFYAALPWLIWIFLRVVQPHPEDHESIQKRLFWFFLINLLATPAFYIQTMFLVYMILLAFLSMGLLFTRHLKQFKTILWRAPLLAGFIIIINLFWLLPQFYFITDNIGVVKEAKSNIFSTVDLFYQNQEKGTLDNFLTFKGFYFDLYTARQGQLFAPWKAWLDLDVIQLVQFGIILVLLLGIITHFRKHRAFLFGFFPVAFALLSATAPFNQLNELFRDNAMLNQIFRAPFTKFIIPHAFFGSIFFASGVLILSQALGKLYVQYKHHRGVHHASGNTVHRTVILVTCLFILVLALPAFRGNYFNREVKQQLPQQYKELFTYFKTVDKNQRIALLPDYTFWGWFFHNWGYNGSGFLWYGIEQPIISRTFDVWTENGESYFWEVKTAIEAEDPIQLQRVIDKYNVDYLVLDYSLFPVSSPVKGLQYDRLEELLANSGRVKEVKRWKDLRVYKVEHAYPVDSFISLAENLPNIGPQVQRMSHDTAYNTHGFYVTTDTIPYAAYYPFLDFMTQSSQPKENWDILKTDKDIIISTERAANLFDQAEIYSFDTGTASAAFTRLDTNRKEETITVPLAVTAINGKISVKLPIQTVQSFNPTKTDLISCGKVSGKIEIRTLGTILQLRTNDNVAACFQYLAETVEQRYSYLLHISTKNVTGKQLFFYILDKTKSQNYTEDLLQDNDTYYVISPKYEYGVGYTFTFQNTSYELSPSENIVSRIDLSYLPYPQLKELKIVPRGQAPSPVSSFSNSYTATKKTYYHYQVKPTTVNDNSTIILHQSFNKGWKAYTHSSSTTFSTLFPFIGGQELQNHVEVNNWANGWIIDKKDILNGSTIHLIFWPQYLEFIGLGFVGVAFLGMIIFLLVRYNGPNL